MELQNVNKRLITPAKHYGKFPRVYVWPLFKAAPFRVLWSESRRAPAANPQWKQCGPQSPLTEALNLHRVSRHRSVGSGWSWNAKPRSRKQPESEKNTVMK